MIYKVRAILKKERASILFRRLTDGTIKKQKPDGEEITAALKRAVLNPNGEAIWYEMCFCAQPLQHERETVLDDFFDIIEISETAAYRKEAGLLLWDLLKEKYQN